MQDRGSREHLIHGADPKSSIQLGRGFLFAIRQSISARKDRLAALRNRDGPRKAILGSPLLDFGLECRNGIRLAQPWCRHGTGNQLETEVHDVVGRARLDLHVETGIVAGIPFFDISRDLRRRGFLDLYEIETARHLAEIHFAIDRRGFFRMILFQVLLDFVPLPAVEHLQPMSELAASGCVWNSGGRGRREQATKRPKQEHSSSHKGLRRSKTQAVPFSLRARGLGI